MAQRPGGAIQRAKPARRHARRETPAGLRPSVNLGQYQGHRLKTAVDLRVHLLDEHPRFVELPGSGRLLQAGCASPQSLGRNIRRDSFERVSLASQLDGVAGIGRAIQCGQLVGGAI